MRQRTHAQFAEKERRGFARRALNHVAQYRCGVAALPRNCMVTDISASGARLYAETEMPDTFTLSVTGGHTDIQRECRVVWRLGGEVGVTFTDGAGG